MYLIDRVGRKLLMMSAFGGMAVSLVGVAAAIDLQTRPWRFCS